MKRQCSTAARAANGVLSPSGAGKVIVQYGGYHGELVAQYETVEGKVKVQYGDYYSTKAAVGPGRTLA